MLTPPNHSNSLEGKVALVTGAADGIGYAIAKAFFEAGATVELSDIQGELMAQGTAALDVNGQRAFSSRCDVADTDSVSTWIAACFGRHRKIDILVNNAAIAIPCDITAMPEPDWTRIINTNLTSAFRTIKCVLPHMIREGGGSIVNIGSTQGHRSWDNWTAYAAAKGGLQAMTRQLAGQFGKDGIRFNTISPGAIDTPLNKRRAEKEGPAFLEASINMHAMRRFGKPNEVAQAAVFLASSGSSFVTGQDLLVDGGLSVLPRYFE